ncbi:hypothetical protein, partial [Escherichia coli]|uniref:hypothetical protein n=1 Tax=Escherichia coli TaxID=562 RepID=UPI001BDB7C07
MLFNQSRLLFLAARIRSCNKLSVRGDPRARLLQGADWQANRIKVYRSLGHPTDPQEAIKSLGHQL